MGQDVIGWACPGYLREARALLLLLLLPAQTVRLGEAARAMLLLSNSAHACTCRSCFSAHLQAKSVVMTDDDGIACPSPRKSSRKSWCLHAQERRKG